MECSLCGYAKPHKHGKTTEGSQRYFCPACQQTFTGSFDTLYYRRQVSPDQVRTVLQSHAEGGSLRGISRITGLAYDTESVLSEPLVRKPRYFTTLKSSQ